MMLAPPSGAAAVLESLLSEERLKSVVDVLVRLVEAAGAVIIFSGAVIGFFRFVLMAVQRHKAQEFVSVRLKLGRYLALGLDFQLAGDILRTAIAPTFEEIGQLAAVAGIRTALNYFLSRELSEERKELEHQAPPQVDGTSPAGSERDGPPKASEAT